MNSRAANGDERTLQLMADQATEGLETIDARELRELLTKHQDFDEDGLERAAAAIDLALMPPVKESLPGPLRAQILNDARRFFETTEVRQPAQTASSEPAVIGFDRVRPRWGGRVGWYAAAASLVLAVLGWWQVLSSERQSVPAGPRLYARFVEGTTDLVRAPWSGKEPGFENVSGEAVWSDSKQDGFMRLVSLPPNDPTVAQYQLWIVDPDRDQHPVDGGVFDVRTAGEVVVPMNAKLKVDSPKVFAITLEKPGGVVVSAGPLLVVGAVPS